MGTKPPTFSTDFTLSAVTRYRGQSFAMMCQAQAFPVPIFRQVYGFIYLFLKNKSSFYMLRLFDAEPVGSKAPSFSTEGTSIKRQAIQNFALLCQAQAFPVPLFRQVL